MVKLSIITINLNNKTGLQKTIDSVINQTFSDFEYIIIDGSSTDGSVDIIKQNANKLSYWVSEPDNGIYNAMNKGTKIAKGEYCMYLNSGDMLYDFDVLTKAFSKSYDEDILYGDVLLDSGKMIVYPEKLSLFYMIQFSIGHGSSFFKRKLFLDFGFYNEKNKIISDIEFLFDALVFHHCSYRYLDGLITCIFDTNGITFNPESKVLSKNEFDVLIKGKYKIFYSDYLDYIETKKELVYQKEKYEIAVSSMDYKLGRVIVNPFRMIKNLFRNF
ncbi:MAG: glycosyltransferase family 2 protein [Bacteroidales bacterium]|nr:glycosyltransferase family 2 protein [Bacteroidales bacterium]